MWVAPETAMVLLDRFIGHSSESGTLDGFFFNFIILYSAMLGHGSDARWFFFLFLLIHYSVFGRAWP